MKTLKIYFTSDKRSFQIIRPSDKFKGDWMGLIISIAGEHYHSYEIY